MLININFSSFILLKKFQTTVGKIHSIFDNSFNCQFGDLLLHVSFSKNFLSSFGIQIEGIDYKVLKEKIHIGDRLKLQDEKIVIYTFFEVITFSYEKKITNLSILQEPFSKERIQDLKDLLEILLKDKENGLLINDGTYRFQVDFKNGDYLTAISHLKNFVGRGKGLTPGGDDFILGYYYIFSHQDTDTAECIQVAVSPLLEKTTIVSSSYLKTGFLNYYSLPVKQLDILMTQGIFNPLEIKKALSNILNIGHTSGTDYCLGMLSAIKHFC